MKGLPTAEKSESCEKGLQRKTPCAKGISAVEFLLALAVLSLVLRTSIISERSVKTFLYRLSLATDLEQLIFSLRQHSLNFAFTGTEAELSGTLPNSSTTASIICNKLIDVRSLYLGTDTVSAYKCSASSTLSKSSEFAILTTNQRPTP